MRKSILAHNPNKKIFFTVTTLLLLPLLQCPWICILCQPTSPKRSFANLNMTSYRDFTSSVYLVTMTTMGLCHCLILEFGRGHPIKQSPRASLDLCTPLAGSDSLHCSSNRQPELKVAHENAPNAPPASRTPFFNTITPCRKTAVALKQQSYLFRVLYFNRQNLLLISLPND